jgi:hypothetical protein
MLCYMTGMTPPTSTNDEQGTVIDGTARSAEWRKKQRAAQTPHAPASPAASDGVPAADFDPAAAKDFVSSVMIPANQIAGETRTQRREPEPPDPYIDTLLNGPADRQPTQELEEDARASATQSDELDRWFEQQATSVPHAPAGQKLPRGSASLDIETAEGASVEHARRGRALGPPSARAHVNRQRRRQPADRRSLRARVHPTRLRVLAVTMVVVLPVAAIAIAAGGSPARHSSIGSVPASISTTFPGLLDTFMSKAGRLPGIEGPVVRAQHHQPRAHRARRAARRRPIAHRAASTGASSSSSYTPQLTSQAESSPAPAAPTSSSTATGGSSSPAPSSSPPTRTGPSGPISLIGAGTTPSG